MSKRHFLSSSSTPLIVLLILTCFCFGRDMETLAQRVKRARASASGQPPACTSGTPLVVLSSPDSSPRHSPQRKLVTRPLSTCVGGMIPWR